MPKIETPIYRKRVTPNRIIVQKWSQNLYLGVSLLKNLMVITGSKIKHAFEWLPRIEKLGVFKIFLSSTRPDRICYSADSPTFDIHHNALNENVTYHIIWFICNIWLTWKALGRISSESLSLFRCFWFVISHSVKYMIRYNIIFSLSKNN